MSSIRRRLATGLLAGLMILLGGGAIALYGFVRRSLYADLDQRLLIEARAITTVIKQEETYIAVGYTDDRIVDFDDKTPTRYYQIWHPEGRTVKRSKHLPEKLLVPKFGTFDRPEVWNVVLPHGRPGRAVGVTFVPDVDSTDRRHYDPELNLGLVVAGDRGPLEQTLGTLEYSLFGGATAISLAVVGLVLTVLSRSLKPLDDLTARATAINVDSLHTRFPEENLPSELQPISARINQLLERLQVSFERERQFSSDVAHELRTPVAELRALTEVLTMWPDQFERENLRDLVAITRQMELVVNGLLVLRRSEKFEDSAQQEAIPIGPMIEGIVQSRAAAIASQSVTVVRNIAPHTHLLGGYSALSMICANLLDNAIRYSPAGGTIQLRATCSGETTILSVTNVTDELASEDVPRLFDRFWRKSGSRDSEGHLGLGLSICHALAVASGWTLSARLEDHLLTLSLAGKATSAERTVPDWTSNAQPTASAAESPASNRPIDAAHSIR